MVSVTVAASAVVVASLALVSTASGYDYYPDKSCYGKGERNMGAKGYPAVPYMPCCDGMKEVKVDYHWGTFCGVAPKPTKCAGAVGKPYVEFVECDHGYHCTEPETYGSWYDWGKYCMPSGGMHKCYKDGERQVGAEGYDPIPWYPCCNGKDAVGMADSYGKKMWGKFCPHVYEEEKHEKHYEEPEYPIKHHKEPEHPKHYDEYAEDKKEKCYDAYGGKIDCPKKCYNAYGDEVKCPKKCYNAYGDEVKCPKKDAEPKPSDEYY